MAGVKTAKEKELDLDKKVTVRSIAEWNTGFHRTDIDADVTFTPKGTFRLPRNEIISQCNNGNKLFTGTDGKGSHATLLIDDAPTRIECGFESEDGSVKQLCFSDELVMEVFGIEDRREFEEAFKHSFQISSEQLAVLDAIKRLGINDYRKIRFAEEHTGYRL